MKLRSHLNKLSWMTGSAFDKSNRSTNLSGDIDGLLLHLFCHVRILDHRLACLRHFTAASVLDLAMRFFARKVRCRMVAVHQGRARLAPLAARRQGSQWAQHESPTPTIQMVRSHKQSCVGRHFTPFVAAALPWTSSSYGRRRRNETAAQTQLCHVPGERACIQSTGTPLLQNMFQHG